jgi:hypothetical protein
MAAPTHDEQIRAQAHVVGLLNEVEAVLTGWVLGEDREAVSKLTSPLYDLCDKQPPVEPRVV